MAMIVLTRTDTVSTAPTATPAQTVPAGTLPSPFLTAPPLWRRCPLWLRILSFPLAYFGAAQVGTALSFQPHDFLSIWLPSGIFLAALLASHTREWPWFCLLVFPTSIAFNSLQGASWQVGSLFTLINCLESLGAAYLLRRWLAYFPQLRSMRELAFIVVIGGVLCTAFGGLLAAALISHLGGSEHFWGNWALWTGAVSIGVMLLTPLCLAWLGSAEQNTAWRRRAWHVEALVLLACLVGSSLLGFTHFWSQGLSLEYLPLPFLVWAALRFGLKGVTLANVVVCVLAAWLTARSYNELQAGPFAPHLLVAQLQLLLVVFVFVGLTPAVMLKTLRLSEERQAAMIDNISDVIAIIGSDGMIRFKSRNIERVFGWKPEKLVGTPWQGLIHPEDLPATNAHFEQLIRTPGASVRLNLRYRRRDGAYLPVVLTAVNQLHDANLRGLLVNYHDDSARKAAEDQLRQAQKMEAVGQLAGGVAHDFNNILAAMMLNLDLMKMDERLPGDLRSALEEQEQQAARAAALTRQLLLFGRRQVLAPRPLEINDTLRNVLAMIRRIIGETIRIEVSSSSPALWVRADAGMIDQVVMNLCVNARDAMPEGGEIRIRCSEQVLASVEGRPGDGARPGRFVCIQIKDTGSGMSPEVLRHAFEPFFTTKPPGSGTGLGLATVHGIVQQHKGWIEVETSPGKGTEFSIFLPADQAPETPQQTASGVQAGPVGGTETLLVVEDEQALRSGVCSHLRKLGYRVLEAASAQEALQHWGPEAASIDLLFTDMVMARGMNGQELSTAFRALKPGLSVILTSGYSEELLNAGDLGENQIEYLPKPYSGEALASLVRSQLDKGR